MSGPKISTSPRRRWIRRAVAIAMAALSLPTICRAEVGDPQVKTSHPWYPGELSCSTFERLFATQAQAYQRATGRQVSTDEDKALASWYWRNLHYAHGEGGTQDCFSGGYPKGETNREYWTGLFAQGFALCGTTHAQYTAEMESLLGHARARTCGVSGHNSFEVYLAGGAYGAGRWALLDHDVSTVIFAPDGSRLLSIAEIAPNLKNLTGPHYMPYRQRGWRISGLHDDDARGAYDSFNTVEYLNGYAGPPPMVNLRRGESMRRYLRPGLEDGKTFVFWGMNYNVGGIPGPTRDRTWVNQPEKMYGSVNGTGARAGLVRFANAVYRYAPDFAGGSYKEGVASEDDHSVTFRFLTPYVIGSTPPNDKKWGVYDEGGRNGLVLYGSATCAVQVSTDDGKTWSAEAPMREGLDLTELVKGFNQYLLRFNAAASALKDAKLSWRTVCQANVATIPRLADGSNTITYHSTGRALVSAGPTRAQAQAHLVQGQMETTLATLELAAPNGARPAHLYASSWNVSGAPPAPVKYQIEYSPDQGKTWQPVVKDWQITCRAPEPSDFWSQSFTYGDVELPAGITGPVKVRFRNDGGKSYRKVEAYLACDVPSPTPVEVNFAWTENGGALKTASHTYEGVGKDDVAWKFDAGAKVETKWVEYTGK